MIPNMNKRRRVESASGAEDSSSFYKRLGLDILTPSSTSCLSQQTEVNRIDSVLQTCRTASQTAKPIQRSDNGVLLWVQSNQRDNRTNTARSDAHHSNYAQWKQSNHAHGYPSNHGHQPSQSHGHRSYLHGHQSTHSNEYQTRRAHTKTDFVNDGAHCWSRHDPLQIHDQSQPRFDRPVRKQPQVKPIDKYAPPDYLTIMYHPTPTLEDLGLTSYLDSPPSSPRAMSPARDFEQNMRAAASEFENDKTEATSCKQTETTAATSNIQTDTTLVAGSKKTDTILPWKLIKITIPDQDVKPAVHLEGSQVGDPRLLFGRRSSGQLPKRKGSVNVGQSQLPQRERSVCDTRHGLRSSQSTAQQYMDTHSSALTGPNDAKRKGPVCSMAENERPNKKLCVWSTVAEQYVTESRQSDNQEARRDAVYRRYSTDGRQCMRQYDKERHQANIRSQTQSAKEESYDEMLARQKARQITHKQNLKPSVQSLKHINCAGSTLFADSDNKTSGPAVSLDLFGGLSPFSCWNRTAPEDPRFS